MKRSKDLSIYEIRLEGSQGPWVIDAKWIYADKAKLCYDYIRVILPDLSIRVLIPYTDFWNWLDDGTEVLLIDKLPLIDGSVIPFIGLKILSGSYGIYTIDIESTE